MRKGASCRVGEDHRMGHRPPGRDSGAPLHDLTGNGVYPKDVYETLWQYRSGDPLDLQAEAVVRRFKGKPDRLASICRAVPKGVRTINPGDWVSIVQGYARQHGKHSSDSMQDMPVICAAAPARDLHTAGDSLLEWGYNGTVPLKGTVVFRPRKRTPKPPAQPRRRRSKWSGRSDG